MNIALNLNGCYLQVLFTVKMGWPLLKLGGQGPQILATDEYCTLYHSDYRIGHTRI